MLGEEISVRFLQTRFPHRKKGSLNKFAAIRCLLHFVLAVL